MEEEIGYIEIGCVECYPAGKTGPARPDLRGLVPVMLGDTPRLVNGCPAGMSSLCDEDIAGDDTCCVQLMSVANEGYCYPPGLLVEETSAGGARPADTHPDMPEIIDEEAEEALESAVFMNAGRGPARCKTDKILYPILLDPKENIFEKLFQKQNVPSPLLTPMKR